MAIRTVLTNAAAATLIAAGALALPLTATAQPTETKSRYTAEDIAKAKPVATFEVEVEQLRLIVGGNSGSGVLTFQGKKYPFTAKGVTVGGIGYTKSHAQGDVYFLKNVEDFAGTYSAATIGAAAGTAGAGGSQYENQKGVYVRVKSKSEGLAINLGLGVVTIEFVK